MFLTARNLGARVGAPAFEEAALAAQCAAAERMVSAHCRQAFGCQTFDERYDGDRLDIVLKNSPVHAILSIEDCEFIPGRRLLTTEYELNPRSGIVTREGGFLPGTGRWRIHYEAGLDPVPPAIEEAAYRVAEALWHQRARDPSVTQQGIGEVSLSFRDPFADSTTSKLLRPYVRADI